MHGTLEFICNYYVMYVLMYVCVTENRGTQAFPSCLNPPSIGDAGENLDGLDRYSQLVEP